MAFLHWHALFLAYRNIDENDENVNVLEAFCRTLSLGQVPQDWQHDGWLAPCYHVFASLIQERLPRLLMDHGLQQYADAAVIHPEERRSFVQNHFGDRMV